MLKSKRLVISAVNCTEGGILSVLQDCVASACGAYGNEWEIIVLVNRKELVSSSVAKVLEFPLSKQSWSSRFKHEWLYFNRLSKRLDPDVWLSLHDMTPIVQARRRVVYCHNALPFYAFRIKDALMDWKLGLFCIFYGWLYSINIRSNDFVVVQQDWIRSEFQRRYNVRNVIVAHPEGLNWDAGGKTAPFSETNSPYFRFCYPTLPRLFKNVEVACEAARLLYESGRHDFELVLTMDGTENAYSRHIRKRFGYLPNILLVGRLNREDVFDLYRRSDCLIFPSKLETWGLPITEFKATKRPILVADLPYAQETIGNYDKVGYFPPNDAETLAELMVEVMEGKFISIGRHAAKQISAPYASSWMELWKLILS
jgi:glycosyltransferase involved in cell wall biosynthesis